MTRRCEWVIEAHGCDAASLADCRSCAALFDQLTAMHSSIRSAIQLASVPGDGRYYRACACLRNRILPAIRFPNIIRFV